MRRRLAVVATLVALVGCATLVGIEETTTTSGRGADASFDGPGPGDAASDGASDAPPGDAAIGDEIADIPVPPAPDGGGDLPPEDDAGDAGGGGGTCTLGTRTAYVPFVPGVVTEVCNEGAALTQGGNVTGLDCHGAGVRTVSGKGVTACVGVEYSTANLASATIRLQRLQKGCLYTCYGGGCGQPLGAHVFVGTGRNIDTWKYVGTASLNPSATNYSFGPFPTGNWKVIGICRNGAGAENEDVGVDGVSAKCR